MEDKLLSQIEEARHEMHRLASLYGLAAPQVLEQSQRLDSLLDVLSNHEGANKRMKHTFFGKFPLGQVVATPGVMEATTEQDRISALTRHHNGDWGEVCTDDWQSNDEALESGLRLLSSFISADGVKFWIITEHDRSVTTFLLPEEY